MTIDPSSSGTFGSIGKARHDLSDAIRSGAFPEVPDALFRLIAIEDLLSAQWDHYSQPLEDHPAFIKRVMDALADGSDELDGDALAAQTRNWIDSADLQVQVKRNLGSLRDQLQGRWERALRAHADALLDGLRSQWEQTRSDLENLIPMLPRQLDVSTLAGATKSQREAVAALIALGNRYGSIRDLQKRVLRSRFTAGTIDGFIELEDALIRGRHEFSDVASAPAPEPDSGPTWYLRVIERDDVWLPSIAAFRDAFRRTGAVSPDPSQELVEPSTRAGDAVVLAKSGAVLRGGVR